MAEEKFLKNATLWSEENGAYSHIQRTRPLAAAYGLNNPPAGLTAWMLEKFRDWSDCHGNVYHAFTPDELLANITVYWMTETIGSSFRLYYESRKASLAFGPTDYVDALRGSSLTQWRQISSSRMGEAGFQHPTLDSDAKGRSLRGSDRTRAARPRHTGILSSIPLSCGPRERRTGSGNRHLNAA